MSKIVGFCGRTGSGKDECMRFLTGRDEDTAGYKHSDVLRRMLETSGLPLEQARFSALFEAVAGQLGKDWIAAEMVRRIRERARRGEDAARYVINGIRNVDEVGRYRRAFGADFRLIALEAPADLRFERVRNRGERPTEHGMTWEQFLAIESLGAHTGEAAVMAMADWTIDNHLLTLGELHDAVSRAFMF